MAPLSFASQYFALALDKYSTSTLIERSVCMGRTQYDLESRLNIAGWTEMNPAKSQTGGRQSLPTRCPRTSTSSTRRLVLCDISIFIGYLSEPLFDMAAARMTRKRGLPKCDPREAISSNCLPNVLDHDSGCYLPCRTSRSTVPVFLHHHRSIRQLHCVRDVELIVPCRASCVLQSSSSSVDLVGLGVSYSSQIQLSTRTSVNHNV